MIDLAEFLGTSTFMDAFLLVLLTLYSAVEACVGFKTDSD